jgi:hypothetical protein
MLTCFAVFGLSVFAAATEVSPAIAASDGSPATHSAASTSSASSAATRAATEYSLAALTVTARAVTSAKATAPAGHAATTFPAALSGFDCRTLTHCVAVGANTPTMATQLVSEGWNGTKWWRMPAVPKPAGTGNVSAGDVACPASHQCVAVGVGYPRTGPGFFAIAMLWNGVRWTTAKAATPGSSSMLLAISCPLPASCYAAGEYTPKGSLNFTPLIEHWNGKTWSQLRIPVPKGTSDGSLFGVSCAGDRFCVAVGTDGAGSLIERWNGRGWTATAPSTAASGTLYGVSCPSPTACFAVGSSGRSTGVVVQRWDGHGWRASAAPVPHGSQFPWLQSVSCPSATRCLAVGDDINPGVYAIAWNGAGWKMVSMAATGPHVGFLQEVRCLSATSCVALGDTTQIAATQRSESAFWNGKTWRVIPTA